MNKHLWYVITLDVFLYLFLKNKLKIYIFFFDSGQAGYKEVCFIKCVAFLKFKIQNSKLMQALLIIKTTYGMYFAVGCLLLLLLYKMSFCVIISRRDYL